MSSRIEYRFRCKKKSSYVTITGQSIPLYRLRDLIMKQEHLDQRQDITLVIQNAQNQKTYNDPNEYIHRNASVVVSRLPKAILEAAQKQEVAQASNLATENGPNAEAPTAPVPQAAIPRQTDETEKEQQKFFYGKSQMPRSFVFRPTRGRVILPYGEVSCFQRTDEPPLSEDRWNLDDLKRWLCPICHRLLRTATSTPCCNTAYCDSGNAAPRRN
ncbi:E3 ubiquitin-protein ligase RBBP6-like [Histomonas meleagridis]|uniref:E3 ubiquitin-protein ligase RBBP6-like n=1 Tax=Histomonas meleagridis TaxID=135588 RepID=UPI003559BB2D|nr:E3 ubiquitin-protein ligase RBBP6-like [Histomonas meleagridis]KAH0805755.1 E3 ubiquitin-protein ligase RBBP6-like [Histomonas meleagridis]